MKVTTTATKDSLQCQNWTGTNSIFQEKQEKLSHFEEKCVRNHKLHLQDNALLPCQSSSLRNLNKFFQRLIMQKVSCLLVPALNRSKLLSLKNTTTAGSTCLKIGLLCRYKIPTAFAENCLINYLSISILRTANITKCWHIWPGIDIMGMSKYKEHFCQQWKA